MFSAGIFTRDTEENIDLTGRYPYSVLLNVLNRNSRYSKYTSDILKNNRLLVDAALAQEFYEQEKLIENLLNIQRIVNPPIKNRVENIVIQDKDNSSIQKNSSKKQKSIVVNKKSSVINGIEDRLNRNRKLKQATIQTEHSIFNNEQSTIDIETFKNDKKVASDITSNIESKKILSLSQRNNNKERKFCSKCRILTQKHETVQHLNGK